MAKKCLACQVTVADIFAPCPACGARPTDPNLCKGPSIEAYQQEQLRGRGDYTAELEQRANEAKGLEGDLLHEVPLQYGAGSQHCHDPSILMAGVHRENIVHRNGGGLPADNSSTKNLRLPYERLLIGAFILYWIIKTLHQFGVW